MVVVDSLGCGVIPVVVVGLGLLLLLNLVLSHSRIVGRTVTVAVANKNVFRICRSCLFFHMSGTHSV
jgi:hypothetical protein